MKICIVLSAVLLLAVVLLAVTDARPSKQLIRVKRQVSRKHEKAVTQQVKPEENNAITDKAKSDGDDDEEIEEDEFDGSQTVDSFERDDDDDDNEDDEDDDDDDDDDDDGDEDDDDDFFEDVDMDDLFAEDDDSDDSVTFWDYITKLFGLNSDWQEELQEEMANGYYSNHEDEEGYLIENPDDGGFYNNGEGYSIEEADIDNNEDSSAKISIDVVGEDDGTKTAERLRRSTIKKRK